MGAKHVEAATRTGAKRTKRKFARPAGRRVGCAKSEARSCFQACRRGERAQFF